MHRIDSDGATVDNKFTEGNSALSIPATVVDADIMNALQEEACALVEGVGITLVKGTNNQLLAAVKELIRRGGVAAPVIQAIANNQASAADVTDFPKFLTTQVIAFEFLYNIYRKTDSGNVKETGRYYASWNAATAAWELTKISVHDEAGVILSLIATATPNEYKLQYVSDDLAGASYAGTLRITDIKTIRVS